MGQRSRGGLQRRGSPSLRWRQNRDSSLCAKAGSKTLPAPSLPPSPASRKAPYFTAPSVRSVGLLDADTPRDPRPVPPFRGAAPLVPSLEGAGPEGKKAPRAFSVELISFLSLSVALWRLARK